VERPDWVPGEVDVTRPSAARVYDYLLGGSHNFAVDREMADRMLAFAPDAVPVVRTNRSFLHRAVRALVDLGVTQFLDLGSGIPTVGNVHEVALRATPDARVVYVDIDPVAVAHSRAMLSEQPNVTVVRADMRDPEALLGSPELAKVLDLDRPTALLMVAVLHFVPDDDRPDRIVRRYRDALAPGSYLALSHLTDEDADPDGVARARALYERTPTPVTFRSRATIDDLFAGFELLDPGLVRPPLWRPDSAAEMDALGGDLSKCTVLAAVGRTPGGDDS
jgi:hypothetical protein